MPVKVTVQTNLPQVTAALSRLPAEMQQRLRSALDKQTQLAIGHITQRYMRRRGPDTLGVVTSRLRNSLRATPAQMEGNTVVATIGTNVSYAAVHEFGYSGTEQVRAHTRRIGKVKGKKSGAEVAKFQGNAFGRPRRTSRKGESNTVNVRAHSRKVNIPARAPIRKGLEDRSGAIASALQSALTNP